MRSHLKEEVSKLQIYTMTARPFNLEYPTIDPNTFPKSDEIHVVNKNGKRVFCQKTPDGDIFFDKINPNDMHKFAAIYVTTGGTTNEATLSTINDRSNSIQVITGLNNCTKDLTNVFGRISVKVPSHMRIPEFYNDTDNGAFLHKQLTPETFDVGTIIVVAEPMPANDWRHGIKTPAVN